MNNNLKEYREGAGLSLGQLGDMCGRTKQQIHQIEKSAIYPKLGTAYLLARALEANVQEIWPDTTEIEVIIRRVRT